MQKTRKHANYYDLSNKDTKESGIAIDFFTLYEKLYGIACKHFNTCEDPPDICAIMDDDKHIAIEITELVNQQAIKYQINNDPKYGTELIWDSEKFEKQLRDIINGKERKIHGHTVKYDSVILLITTNEPKLEAKLIADYLQMTNIKSSSEFNEIFIMTGPLKKDESKLLKVI